MYALDPYYKCFRNYTPDHSRHTLAFIVNNQHIYPIYNEGLKSNVASTKRLDIKSVDLKENSFGIEPEITIKLAKKKKIFFEVPISYYGRGYEEGKKIRTLDAFKALYCLFKYSFIKYK